MKISDKIPWSLVFRPKAYFTTLEGSTKLNITICFQLAHIKMYVGFRCFVLFTFTLCLICLITLEYNNIIDAKKNIITFFFFLLLSLLSLLLLLLLGKESVRMGTHFINESILFNLFCPKYIQSCFESLNYLFPRCFILKFHN